MTDNPRLRTCLFTDSTQKENHERLFIFYLFNIIIIDMVKDTKITKDINFYDKRDIWDDWSGQFT